MLKKMFFTVLIGFLMYFGINDNVARAQVTVKPGIGTVQQPLKNAIDVNEKNILMTGTVNFTSSGNTFCSGSLITPMWVLTAAHCSSPFSNISSVKARLGNQNEGDSQKFREVRVAQTFIHPKANVTGCLNDTGKKKCRYDAMLVKLQQPLYPVLRNGTDDWTSYCRDIYRASYKDLAGYWGNIYGYGRTSRTGGGAGVLRFGKTEIDSVGSYYIHADDPAKIRPGDSGTALLVPPHEKPNAFADYQIIGIASHEKNRPVRNDIHRFTKAEPLIDWFDGIVGSAVQSCKEANSQFKHFLVGDWTGNGTSDLIAPNTFGLMFLFEFQKNSFKGEGKLVGHNFNFSEYFVGDWTGDGISDLIARSGGSLILYPFKKGRFYNVGGGQIVGKNFHRTDLKKLFAGSEGSVTGRYVSASEQKKKQGGFMPGSAVLGNSAVEDRARQGQPQENRIKKGGSAVYQK